MSQIQSENKNGLLTVALSGRIDSSNVGEVEAELEAVCASEAYSAIVLDVEELQYISSAGLRMVLRLRKNEPTLEVINATSEVYEIFEMTGFTEMIPVSKAYRRLSVEGCEVIGQGANGKVYRLDADTIIKVYLNPDSLPDIHRERELARKAFVMGIPTAIPYDVVKVGDGYGSVFELLNAKSFAKLIAAEPENLQHYIDLYIDLLRKIHATELKPGDMPDMKQVALKWADFMKDHLPEEYWRKLRTLVEGVPEDHHMLHGDYHIKNVMMQDGEVLLIDMDTLCMGHPVFEFASMYMAYLGYSENDHGNAEGFLGIPYETSVKIWEQSLRLYFGTEDEQKIREYADMARTISYTRMIRSKLRRHAEETEIGRRNIATWKANLMELLDRIDTLEF